MVTKPHKPSERGIDLSTDNPVAFQTSTRFDDNSAVLLACDSLLSSPSIQENCILAATNGKLKPILLTSSSENSVTEGSSTSTNADNLFKHIVSTSQIYDHIADEELVELSEQIIFAGCILSSGSTASLFNCVETYGRLKSVDAHHERRTSSSIRQSSFPKSKSKYGQIEICLAHDDNTTMLKIGATICNLFVTSSVRLDKQTIANKTIEMGPNANNFIPLPDARINLNLAQLKVGQNYWKMMRPLV
ncbi:uncharacterized protein EV154DRAFT_585434 [Mucor mucedo]|uniref:uncharacterized protein n=1 Tax=Mucor mucedo TaxID=29922 RepID=UPI0022201A55|nr:uncharacterized protein EV154DRAFT_585434 [Mucor mucedo]KAI7864634.1 hypothetical protein EV154DRAFT_585434 [Mucor mucedo]